MKTILNFLIIGIIVYSCKPEGQDDIHKIDLSGEWRFQSDPFDKGIEERWFTQTLNEKIDLPGSMTTNDKGDDITINTPWTGSIFDSSWFFKPEYARFREPGNIKVPFWLQPDKYYKGAAWYQKTITIPPAWSYRQCKLFIERSHWQTSVWVDDKMAGIQNSLSTAQVFDLTSFLKPGEHQITIMVDNRIKDFNVGPNSHSISDHTQSNWNGMIGELYISAQPVIYIEDVQLYPDVKNKEVRAKILIKNSTGTAVTSVIELAANIRSSKAEKLTPIKQELNIVEDSLFFETVYPMGNNPLLWDEFDPNVYTMTVQVTNGEDKDEKSVSFGMREFKTAGTQFTINGRKTFLRGTLECAIFPLTGFPPTDEVSWMKIFKVARSYGLNHMRFHSWCPPEAAFEAADKSGFYLQVECASWANWGSALGDGAPIDQYIYDESERIVKAYGNHPSFCMLTYGNEPAGKNHESYLRDFENYWKKKDDRRLYTAGSGWPTIPDNEYHIISKPRIQLWNAGLKSIINSEPPRNDYDWSEIISKYTIPTVSHEIGQWCAYPDFKEIKKYTGVLKAKNFEIFQYQLEKNGMAHLADSFLLASGKLQALCYKADIEAALRTPGFGGFQLLDLHDFPGQGTALVGVLNPFWEDKGYITGKEYSHFCNSTVPLARFPKMIYLNNEDLNVPVEIAHFGPAILKNVIPKWTIKNSFGKILFQGELPATNISFGNYSQLGVIHQTLTSIAEPSKLNLTVSVGDFQNSWDWFVYPASLPDITNDILVTQDLNNNAIQKLAKGGKVLLTLKKGSIKKGMGGDIAVGFSSIFWNTAWTNGQAPHTFGVLVNPGHPALKEFPTDYHSNWQWWDAMSHSDAIILDSVSKNLKPIVRVIDDWVTARPLGLVSECRVGKGKLIVSSIDLLSNMEKRYEARQLLYSLTKYMSTPEFDPKGVVDLQKIEGLIN